MQAHLIALCTVASIGCSSEGGSIEVLIGNRDGTFRRGQSLSTAAPRAIALADLDGAVAPELEVAHYDNLVTTYAAFPRGEYVRDQGLEVDASPNSIASADLNGDRENDLIVACDGKLDVMLGAGNGQMYEATSFPGGANTAVATLDFDHDARVDVAIVDSSNVVLLGGHGDGTLETAQVIPLDSPLHELATVDLDGDGNTDILATAVTVDLLAEHGLVYVLLARPGGFIQAVHHVPNPGESLLVSDFNNDSVADLIVTGGTSVAIALGTGDGTFAPFTDHVFGSGARSAVASDFDRDGYQDLAVIVGGAVSVALGSDEGLGTPRSYDAGPAPAALVAVDIDDDGRRDLVVSNDDRN